MTIRRKGGFDLQVLLGAGAVLYLCWNIGTAVGLILGDVIGDPNQLGLDAAFAALFLALLVPQLRGRREVTAALLGGGIALTLIPFTPAGVPIVAGAAGSLVGWMRRMSPVWTSVLAVGAATIALKATGPVLLGRRELPSWLAGPVSLLAPAVLAAFVVTQAVGGAPRHRRGCPARRPRRGSDRDRAARTDPGGRDRRGGGGSPHTSPYLSRCT